jgi:hypothetical protein
MIGITALLTSALLFCGAWGSSLGPQDSAAPLKADQDPLTQIVGRVQLNNESIFSEITRLGQEFDISISIEGVLPTSGQIANPKFTAAAENQTIAMALDWLCARDTRYAWIRDGNMVNLLPRSSLNDKSYSFNRILPNLQFQDVRESGVAAMEVVYQLGDPNEQLYFMGVGGTQNFAKPWTAAFHDITVREALNRIAQQLGPSYGWQIGGTTKQRMIMFHYKLGAHPGTGAQRDGRRGETPNVF